jgi:cell division protein FtsW
MARLKTDWILFLTILAMVAFGLVMVYSASSPIAELRNAKAPYYFAVRQLGWALLSFIVLMYFKRLDYRRLNTPAWAFSGLGIVLGMLVAVYFLGSHQRWFKFAGVSFQPSEFAKPALIVFLAYFLDRRARVINDRRTLQQAFVAVAMLAGVVVVADLGTAMVPVITAVIVFWVAGLEKRYMIRAGAIAGVLGIAAIVSSPYRLKRVIGFVDPNYTKIEKIDTQGRLRLWVERSTNARVDTTYQPLQSKIAVGSGGVLGVGLTQGKQKLMFLPEPDSDFIYATIGEELGLWGATAVLAGFLVILWRGARLFVLARDDFGKYLALGVTVAIVVQALMNISVVLDMGPTKGFPLPMISLGGSSLLSTLTCLGMLLSVSEHEG